MTTYTILFYTKEDGTGGVLGRTAQVGDPPGTETHVDELHEAIRREAEKLWACDIDMEFLLDPNTGLGLGTIYQSMVTDGPVLASFRINLADEKEKAVL
jgi:hypothetical protein